MAFRCIPCLVKCSLFCSNFSNVASLKGFTIFVSLLLKESTSLLIHDVYGRSNLCGTPIKTKLVWPLFFTKREIFLKPTWELLFPKSFDPPHRMIASYLVKLFNSLHAVLTSVSVGTSGFTKSLTSTFSEKHSFIHSYCTTSGITVPTTMILLSLFSGLVSWSFTCTSCTWVRKQLIILHFCNYKDIDHSWNFISVDFF